MCRNRNTVAVPDANHRESLNFPMSYEERSLKQALIARWDILPDYIKHMHWQKFNYRDKWVLTYQHVNFDSWRYITFGDWDIAFDAGLYAKDEDPVVALQRVFEDRQEHPEILEVLFYPSAKVSSPRPSQTYPEVARTIRKDLLSQLTSIYYIGTDASNIPITQS